MIREKAPTILTTEGARRLTSRIRDAMSLADSLVVQAYEGRIWEVSQPSYPSWDDYAISELPHLRMVKLKSGPRREVVARLRATGHNITQIAEYTGAGVGTIHRDLVALEGGHTREPSFPNGKGTVPADEPVALTAEVIEEATNWMAVLRLVRRAGDAGLTSAEFLERVPPRPADDTRKPWHHGSVSPAFLSCERKGYIQRLAEFRAGYAIYVSVRP